MENSSATISRQDFIDSLLKNVSNILTKDEYVKFRYSLLNASNSELEELIDWGLHARRTDGYSQKDFLNDQKKIMETKGIDGGNTSAVLAPATFLKQKDNAEFLKEISHSSPSDHICLDRYGDLALMSLWEDQNPNPTHFIPSDLFFAKTIPLLDFNITIDERKDETCSGTVCDCRIVIFQDYTERIEEANGNTTNVGAIIVKAFGIKLYIRIFVCEGFDEICIGEIGYSGATPLQIKNIEKSIKKQQICDVSFHWLETWYGIQIALLHPLVKTVFQKSTREVVYNGDSAGKRKRKTCYVKKHIIKADDIEKAQYGDERNPIKRKTLVWYVIGHWRHYSDGKKVFVKPYWKGPLRDLKKNLDDGREREIAVGGAS